MPDDVCATGCAAVRDSGEAPTSGELAALFERAHAGPWSGANLALETLLFHGAETRAWLGDRDTYAHSLAEQRFGERLDAELARQHAQLEVRFRTETGRTVLQLEPTRVPLGVKQHLWTADVDGDLQVPEISGTVRRVGLDHLWTRL